MDFFSAIQSNLLSPAVLFFVLGVFAAVTKSDLKIPEALYASLTIYLLIAIGFKGGEELFGLFRRTASIFFADDQQCGRCALVGIGDR